MSAPATLSAQEPKREPLKGAVQVWIALGANLGDPLRQLEGAVRALRADPDVVVRAVSPWYRTPAVGGPEGQPEYLNGVLAAHTRLAPEGLLRRLNGIERAFGRATGRARARAQRNGPRPLDLDLLFYGERTLNLPGLIVPHPRIEERPFVLVPLADLAPERLLPGCGRTVRQRLAELGAVGIRREPARPGGKSDDSQL